MGIAQQVDRLATVLFGTATADTARNDAFGRFRVSQPETLFDSQFQYGTLTNVTFNAKVAGGGTVAHLPNESSVLLSVTNASGDAVVFQSKRYVRYQPGKSYLVFMTGVFGAGVPNCVKRWGYFDGDNGIYWEQDGDTIAVVLRSKVSGVVSETVVTQDQWNLDKFDGTGPSHVTLDPTKSQILAIDLEWLGAGRVRIGFMSDGQLTFCHQFLNANVIGTAYMSTANLPVRYEISNAAELGAGQSMRTICQTVLSEGPLAEQRYLPFSVSNGITEIGVTTRRPILSIRPKATLNAIVNRGEIIPVLAAVEARTNDTFIEIVYNGALTGGAGAYNSVNAESLVEYNIDRTGIAGGLIVASFFAISGAGAARNVELIDLLSRLPLVLDIDGANPIDLSIVATAFTGTPNVSGILSWREAY